MSSAPQEEEAFRPRSALSSAPHTAPHTALGTRRRDRVDPPPPPPPLSISDESSTISSWDQTSLERGDPSSPVAMEAMRQLRKDFSWPNIKSRCRTREGRDGEGQKEGEAWRELRETDIVKDPAFRAAFDAMDEKHGGRVPER